MPVKDALTGCAQDRETYCYYKFACELRSPTLLVVVRRSMDPDCML